MPRKKLNGKSLSVQEKCLIAGIGISTLTLMYSIFKDIRQSNKIIEQQQLIIDNQNIISENQQELIDEDV